MVTMDHNGEGWDDIGISPPVICDIATENGPVEIVSCPMNNMVIFHIHVNVYGRVHYKPSIFGYPSLWKPKNECQ